MILSTLLVAALGAPLQESPSSQESTAEARIPVLLVSGANNHDWKWTTPSLQRILEGSGRFEVDLTYEPAKDLVDAERLARARAIVLDYNGKSWGDEAHEAFLQAVRGGTGVVVIHAANNSGVGWPEYEKLVGDLWRKGTGHGGFHAFDVDIVDRDHPVSRSLPTILMHPDELYHRLVNPHGVERRVLATAYSSKESGGIETHEPMVLVKSYGEGRVFHTPLGHVWSGNPAQQASHRDPQFQGLVIRGTEWAATGTVRDVETAPAPLTDAEVAAGWTSLMDEGSWRAFSGADLPEGWRFDGETITRTAKAGDIVTRELFGDFELRFQWKTTIAGNSGVKYRIGADAKQPIGPEYQLLDHWSEVENPKHRAGAIYDVIGVEPGTSAGVWGEYHDARIVARGARLEHWLDGVLVASADTSSKDWAEAIQNSKFKAVAGFAAAGPGRILLQDHGDEVWIRGLRVRRLGATNEGDDSDEDDGGEPLFSAPGAPDGAQWSNVGDATYEVTDDGVLIGRAGPNRRQSFLVSNETAGDFVLEVDVRIATLGNSGIQLRSKVNGKGRLQGYQAEIDQTKRAWSGGIFDEGRRGWLDDLKDDEAARAAFDLQGWNRYRIECLGPRIRTWVNGVPAANLLDGLDLEGSIAFQIHGGDEDIEIHWRDARLRRIGRHEWIAGDLPAPDAAVTFDEAPGLRLAVEGDTAALELLGVSGNVLHSLALGGHDRWRAGAENHVTVLRDGARVVVQLGDRTAHEVAIDGVRAVRLAGTAGAPRVHALWTCLPAPLR